ncbi:hypothetical protein BGX27_009541 [Mortierella sp. AM989]|nr:hypothetical protein BGX27_009541 [Mortierella sp. AM989]
MQEININDLPQAFRAVYEDEVLATTNTPTSKTVSIKPRFDRRSGEHFILWRDVQAAFKNSTHAQQGDTAVSFLVDDDFEYLQPLRIPPHPGVILDVMIGPPEADSIMGSQGKNNSTMLSTTSSTILGYHSPPSSNNTTIFPSPSVSTSESSHIQHPIRAPQDCSESPESSSWTVSEFADRAPQSLHSTQRTVEEPSAAVPDCKNTDIQENNEQKSTESYNQGLAYYEGNDIPRDYRKAMTWFLKAAVLGHAGAENCIGLMYLNEYGVDLDYFQGVQWIQKAATQGNSEAQYNLGLVYHHGDDKTRDYVKAAEWYQKAADQGNCKAFYHLGRLYEMGSGVALNYLTAAEWYEKAADKGCGDAQFHLALMYQNGLGVTKSEPKAISWYQKSSEQGNVEAHYNLGLLHEKFIHMGIDPTHHIAFE